MSLKIAIIFAWLVLLISKSNLVQAQCKKAVPRGHVLVWLDADCPLSQKGICSMKTLYQQYADSSIQFLAIFPENHKHKAKKFMRACGLSFPFIIDHKDRLTSQFGATTTPETVLLTPLQQVKYQGQIDNMLISTETFRLQPTEFYLKNAIEAMLQQKEIDLEKNLARRIGDRLVFTNYNRQKELPNPDQLPPFLPVRRLGIDTLPFLFHKRKPLPVFCTRAPER